jgi:hypothetical protein
MKEQAKKNTAINHTIPPLEQIIRKRILYQPVAKKKANSKMKENGEFVMVTNFGNQEQTYLFGSRTSQKHQQKATLAS